MHSLQGTGHFYFEFTLGTFDHDNKNLINGAKALVITCTLSPEAHQIWPCHYYNDNYEMNQGSPQARTVEIQHKSKLIFFRSCSNFFYFIICFIFFAAHSTSIS